MILRCKLCNSKKLVKDGFSYVGTAPHKKKVQRYLCNNCHLISYYPKRTDY